MRAILIVVVQSPVKFPYGAMTIPFYFVMLIIGKLNMKMFKNVFKKLQTVNLKNKFQTCFTVTVLSKSYYCYCIFIYILSGSQVFL